MLYLTSVSRSFLNSFYRGEKPQHTRSFSAIAGKPLRWHPFSEQLTCLVAVRVAHLFCSVL